MLRRYARWLHTRWPDARVEKLPEVRPDGSTAVPGLYVAGDLAGTPLLKFALDGGTRVARRIAGAAAGRPPGEPALPDLAIVGAGAAGMAAALEAKRLGLAFVVLEAVEPFATLVHLPRAKPIFTYPSAMTPAGELRATAPVKEALVDELRAQVAASGIEVRPGRAERVEPVRGGLAVRLEGGATVTARNVLLAVGRSGGSRRLGVPGESLPKVYDRLHDPADFARTDVLVVGGGDSALETVALLAGAGARVTLAHRGDTLARPGEGNRARLEELRRAGAVTVLPSTVVREIREREVLLQGPEGPHVIPNGVVFTLLGRSAPLELLRRSGVPIRGEIAARGRLAMAAFLLACAALYDWKSGGFLSALWYRRGWFPVDLAARLAAAGGAVAAAAANPRTLPGTLAISAAAPAFWVTLAYSLVVTLFGIARIRRRRTPYVTAQTLTLVAIQVGPLFLLPEVVLPLLDHNGMLPRALADALFPAVAWGHGREFWRAYGLILAWPLDVYNVLTREPLWAWIAIGFVQTFVLIPLAVLRWGKGAYCGWICSCGALAETLGDTHRHKMPHGPAWNRLNLAGQAVLAVAVAMLLVRIAGWMLPEGNLVDRLFDPLLGQGYKWIVDVFLASVVGVGTYFWYSGRVWCRFFCPLAAWMNVIARFSRFAIVADKPKCISCAQCTSECHMGIDVMAFANRGLPMQDPQCVRCSACVHACPTGVLQFGQVDAGGTLIRVDSLLASPVRGRERV